MAAAGPRIAEVGRRRGREPGCCRIGHWDWELWRLRLCCRTVMGWVSACAMGYVEELRRTYTGVNASEEELGVPVMFGQGETLGLPFAGFHLKVYA